jgi:hypothetical protein
MKRERPGQRRHRRDHGHAVLLHHRQEGVELEARQRHHAAARPQRRVEQDRPEDVRERDDACDDVLRRQAREREGAKRAEHGDRARVRVRRALRQPGRAARAHEQREVAGVPALGDRGLGLRKRFEREHDLVTRGRARDGKRRRVGEEKAGTDEPQEGAEFARGEQRVGGRQRQPGRQRAVHRHREAGAVGGDERDDVAAPRATRTQAGGEALRPVGEFCVPDRAPGGRVEHGDPVGPPAAAVERLVVQQRRSRVEVDVVVAENGHR